MLKVLLHFIGQVRQLKKPVFNIRGYVLLSAILLLLVCLFKPVAVLPTAVYDWYVVLDITQSMNVRDYTANNHNVSRLEFIKAELRKGLRALPCGSKVALGMFTERNALNIVRPVEVCTHYSALDQTISKMDWRMAWAADSFIAHGVYSAIEQTPKLGEHTRVLFITDGQQAPPANPKYMPSFAGKVGQVKGIILGAGKTTPSQIPKLDDRNEVAGYWDQEEVLRYGSFGMAETLSALAMEQGQQDRNSGHGAGSEILSTAHLSGLDEKNLKNLAKQTGLVYQKLADNTQLGDVLTQNNMSTYRNTRTDLRPWLAIPTFILILIFIVSSLVVSGTLAKKLRYFKKQDVL